MWRCFPPSRLQCGGRCIFRDKGRIPWKEGVTITLRKKLILAFTVLIVLLGSWIGYFSYQDAKNIVYANKKSEMADTINRIDIDINTWVLQIVRLAENTSQNQAVLELLEDGGVTALQRNYIDEWFHNFAQVFVAVSDIHIIDSDGGIRYSYVPFEGYVDEGRLDACTQAAAARPDRETWLGIGRPLCRESGEDVVTMVRAFNPGQAERSDGILVIELNPDVFSSLLLSNHSMFPNQYTLIVDRNGDIISTNKKVEHTWLNEIENMFGKGIRKFELHWEGKGYYVCGQYNGVTGWKTFSIVSLNDFFPQASELRRAVFTMVAAAVLLAAVVILLISYTFTRPIGRLMTAMKEIEKGDFKIQVVNKSRDEIGRLTQSFNFMVSKIDQLVKEVYQEKIAQKNAELEALQAQINPHFLYNTLDSINWMLMDIGADDISDVVVSLGDILKYSIHGKDVLVLLDEEIQYIESYLCIQKNRLEERLKTSIDIQDKARACMVPKLILQPMVENAILHGVEPMKEGGEVCITARLEQDDLFVTIEDNGPGMDQEELKRCRAAVYCETGTTDSIGMRNVHRRLRLHFGERYGMTIESGPRGGTAVVLRMPGNRRWREQEQDLNGHSDCG